ncbi:hypothetical protein N7532_001919 [Penicillium argentinense]|uniref:Uncharacterized protein n=1 Tax=Penicillium argentinense TaxID=1131581 RepID=A0A9W9G3F6_9EURO|nr:uncharacterized protein N7532_001919 [Penicillium argentinense]KAJ5111384.1 hypothetical protein N7532_001919 [Penicillium argentinense]
MLAPNYYTHPYAYNYRVAPPVRPSRSLEGLERVIPPTSPKSIDVYSPTRSELFLNKPLPAKPLPSTPSDDLEPEYSGMWSDSSDDESDDSTLDSIASPEPRASTESYPIFVSGADDILGDPPAPADRSVKPIVAPQRLLSRTDSFVSDTSTKSDAQYGRPALWSQPQSQYQSQTRAGTNHYFREKKWDFFPELATPGAVSAVGRASPEIRNGKTRKKQKPGRLNLSKRRRWHSLDRPGMGMGLAQARDSIKTYVHRTLSRDSPESRTKAKDKDAQRARPATAPANEVDGTPKSTLQQWRGLAGQPLQHSSLGADVNLQMRALSLHTMSSTTASTTSDMPDSPRSARFAVPMTAYQKYGASIWDAPKFKKRTLRPRQQPGASRSSSQLASINPTSPLSPPLKTQLQQNTRDAVRVLQGGTSHMLVALDGAKKKISESKDERRREQLKAQIKLVGPVNPHTCGQLDPWV